MRLLTLLLLSLFTSLSLGAQEKGYTISPPLDIGEVGWNKVLCMKNGNTLLFHFEPTKRIFVKVFDSVHKQVASRQDPCKVIDVFLIEYAVFKGLYEINGEAVMFLDQDIRSKHCLVMLRYNATTGALIEERLVGESKSENRRIQYYVMKNKENDNYEVLFCMDKRHPKQADIFLVYFDKYHKSLKEVQLEVSRKKYDYLNVIGAESQPNGVVVTLGLDKPLIYGRAADLQQVAFAQSDHDSAIHEGGPVSEHYVAYYYIPTGDSVPRCNITDVSEVIYPYYSVYTYNPLASAFNLLLFSYKEIYYHFGLNEYMGAVNSNLFFKVDEHDLTQQVGFVRHAMASAYFRKERDTSHFFQGLPVKVFTNANGLTTVFAQTYTRFGEPETSNRFNNEIRLDNIGITQVDDSGKEIWGTVLPVSQYYKSYKGYFDEKEFCKRWQDQVIFGDFPAQVYNRQFLSFNVYQYNRNFYMIFNDYNKNFNSTLKQGCTTVYSFDNTNAVFYKLDRKKEVTKGYMFGDPMPKEYKRSFIEGADFDEQRGIYASAIHYEKNGTTSVRMAWRRLD